MKKSIRFLIPIISISLFSLLFLSQCKNNVEINDTENISRSEINALSRHDALSTYRKISPENRYQLWQSKLLQAKNTETNPSKKEALTSIMSKISPQLFIEFPSDKAVFDNKIILDIIDNNLELFSIKSGQAILVR